MKLQVNMMGELCQCSLLEELLKLICMLFAQPSVLQLIDDSEEFARENL
jgi:hypothetical protein